jgi:hypothetical protein
MVQSMSAKELGLSLAKAKAKYWLEQITRAGQVGLNNISGGGGLGLSLANTKANNLR